MAEDGVVVDGDPAVGGDDERSSGRVSGCMGVRGRVSGAFEGDEGVDLDGAGLGAAGGGEDAADHGDDPLVVGGVDLRTCEERFHRVDVGPLRDIAGEAADDRGVPGAFLDPGSADEGEEHRGGAGGVIDEERQKELVLNRQHLFDQDVGDREVPDFDVEHPLGVGSGLVGSLREGDAAEGLAVGGPCLDLDDDGAGEVGGDGAGLFGG